MKKTSRKILCVMLCVMLCVSSVIPVFASGGLSIADIIKGAISSGLGSGSGSGTGDNLGDMISQMITGGSLGDVNIAELLAKKLEGEIKRVEDKLNNPGFVNKAPAISYTHTKIHLDLTISFLVIGKTIEY